MSAETSEWFGKVPWKIGANTDISFNLDVSTQIAYSKYGRQESEDTMQPDLHLHFLNPLLT